MGEGVTLYVQYAVIIKKINEEEGSFIRFEAKGLI